MAMYPDREQVVTETTEDYTYFSFLVSYAEHELASSNDYYKVALDVLKVSNHGHNGWTVAVDNFFNKPNKTREEQALCDRMTSVIQRVVASFIQELRLVNFAEPDFSLLYHVMDIELATTILAKLGLNAPKETYVVLKALVEEAAAHGAPAQAGISIPIQELLEELIVAE